MIALEYAKNARQAVLRRFREKYYYYTEERFAAKLSKWLQKNLGYPLNLDNPQTFNQKIQWLTS